MWIRVVLACVVVCAAGCDQVFGLERPDAGGGPDAVAGRIEYRQSKSASLNGVTTVTVTFDEPVLAGDLVVVALGLFNAALPNIVDTAGNTYRRPMGAIVTPAGGTVTLAYAPNVATASPFTVTATIATGSSPEISLAIHAYRGAAIEPLDAYTGGKGTSPSPTSGKVITTEDHELWFGALSHDNTAVTQPGPDFRLREVPTEDNQGVPLATEDRLDVPAQTDAAKFTLDATSGYGAGLMTFRPSAQ